MLQPEQILEAALALEPAERARLAKEIIASLDGPVEVEPELAGDIERRIREIDSGEVKAIPWAEVKARIASRRRAR
jgi:putative addiction module component (TIGR02574 family)